MRRFRVLCSLLLVLTLSLGLVPARADIIEVDPRQPTKITPDQATYDKLVKLSSSVGLYPLSGISPDDQTQLVAVFQGGEFVLAFINVQSGALVPVKLGEDGLPPLLTSLSWLDNKTLVYFSANEESVLTVALDATTGAIKTAKSDLPGYPVSLAPNASRVLIAVLVEAGASSLADVEKGTRPTQSPFDIQIRRGYSVASPIDSYLSRLQPAERARMGYAQSQADLQASSFKLGIASVDLTNGKITPLFLYDPLTAFNSFAWSPDGSQLAIGRTVQANISTQGSVLSDLAVQDGLGQLRPEANPFFVGNAVDVASFASGKIKPAAITAAESGGDTFGSLSWSSDGQTLLAQTLVAAKLIGRANPVYLQPERAYLRFYSPDGNLLGTFEKGEVDTPAGTPVFVSPNEVLINAPYGTSARIFYYNRTSGEFRQLPIPEGEAFRMQATSPKTRQVILPFSSFSQAPEHYRMSWDGTGLTAITNINAEATAFGKVQADPVSFTLKNGQTRTGYLLQAPGSAFPPSNAKVIMWQEGGPTAPYLNRFSSSVEAPFNTLPNFGYAVLFVPLPGRYGFGPQFLNALADDKNFGSIDIDEGAEIMQQVIGRGWASADGIGITGCSYGGYFTSQSIARHPGLYKAANTQCTLLDLIREFQSGQTAYISYLEGRSSTTDAAEYVNDSPLFNVPNIKTPTLIFAGVYDFLPYQVSVNFHDQLRNNGAATNMAVFNLEGHGLGIATNQLIAAQAQLDWFRQYLK